MLLPWLYILEQFSATATQIRWKIVRNLEKNAAQVAAENNHPLRWQHSTAHNVSPEIQLPIITAYISRLSRDLNFSHWMLRNLLCMRIWLFFIFTNLIFRPDLRFTDMIQKPICDLKGLIQHLQIYTRCEKIGKCLRWMWINTVIWYWTTLYYMPSFHFSQVYMLLQATDSWNVHMPQDTYYNLSPTNTLIPSF